MTGILLTRESAYQVHCANTLFASGIIDRVIIESGRSAPRRSAFDLGQILGAVPRLINDVRSLRRRFHQALNLERYYGAEELHNSRLLGEAEISLDEDLPVSRVASVNAPEAAAEINAAAPDIVFVFGTGMISKTMIESLPCPAVNLHFGWSPDYRGEGIITALALEGPKALGVTVHLLNARSDAGDILHRQRIASEPIDNFYALSVKSTLAGIALFKLVDADLKANGVLHGEAQDLSAGQLFSKAYMDAHTELYPRAWTNLKSNAEPSRA